MSTHINWSEMGLEGERRSSRRVPVAVAVKQRCGDTVFLCQAGDISDRGMLLARVSEPEDEAPDKFWLEFTLPGFDRLIVARGAVVRQQYRSRYHLIAVRFAAIAPSHRRLIRSYAQVARPLRGVPAFLS